MNNLHAYPVQVRIPIAWGEMDAFQHVNNIWYFRYFECVRAKYFDEIGALTYREQTGIGPILAETKCTYLQALAYPDTITVGTRTKSIGNTSIVMEYLIVSDKIGPAASGEVVIVMFNYKNSQKVSVPQVVRENIEKLESLDYRP